MAKRAKLTNDEVWWYAGVCAALAVVKLHGQDTTFDEIVQSVGATDLIAEARRRGVMRWSGLSEWVKREKGGKS